MLIDYRFWEPLSLLRLPVNDKGPTCQRVGEAQELAFEAAQDPALVEGRREVEGETDGCDEKLVDHQVEEDQVERSPELQSKKYLYSKLTRKLR